MDTAEFIGKLVIVGLTRVDPTGRQTAQTQLHGRILRVSKEEGLVLELANGSEYRLPPDLSALQPAPQGDYTESRSGITIKDPDYLALWRLRESAEPSEGLSWEKGPPVKFVPRP